LWNSWRVFHEKAPDLNEVGVRHFEKPYSSRSVIRLLRYTRHNVFFEANNRLFSLSPELAQAFPKAGFIHLFRHPAAAVRSAMSKPTVEDYLQRNIRFSGSLAGDATLEPFERFCHYWTNVNNRIHDDLCQIRDANRSVSWLEFDDLVAGKVEALEAFLDVKLKRRTRPPSNVGPVRTEGKFPAFEDWNNRQRQQLDAICGPLYEKLVAAKRDTVD